MGKSTWKISIADGFCEYQYRIGISSNESIDSVYEKIRQLFKADKRKGILRGKTKEGDRFREFDPQEREALRVLVTNHLNTVSEISLHKDFRIIGYLDYLAKIEQELIYGAEIEREG